MDSIFEKITLYDILGYGFPGFFFLLVVLMCFFGSIPSSIIALMKDYESFFAFSIVVLSHVTGTVLSEIARIISKIFSKCECLCLSSISCDINSIIKSLNQGINDDKGYNKDELSRALKKANVSFDSTVDMRLIGYIYSVVQTDSKFSRIHTYASAAVMCRNTATACLIGSGLVIGKLLNNCSFRANQVIFAVCLLGCALLLSIRSRRFEEKKYYYAINWFIFKYNGSTTMEIDKVPEDRETAVE